MHPDLVEVLNIENFLGFQKLKEDSREQNYRKEGLLDLTVFERLNPEFQI